jgi:hypothetical protein
MDTAYCASYGRVRIWPDWVGATFCVIWARAMFIVYRYGKPPLTNRYIWYSLLDYASAGMETSSGQASDSAGGSGNVPESQLCERTRLPEEAAGALDGARAMTDGCCARLLCACRASELGRW